MIRQPRGDPGRRARATIWSIATGPLGDRRAVPGDGSTMTARAPQPLPAWLARCGRCLGGAARRNVGLRLHRARRRRRRCRRSRSCRRSTATSSTSTGPSTSHPKVFKGFEEEYGVKIIESNFDSMESMQAKLAAGNRYDIIFPSAQWVQKLTAANQLRPIDHSTLENAAGDLRPLRLLRRPLVRPGARPTRSRSRCTRPGSPGARTSSATS